MKFVFFLIKKNRTVIFFFFVGKYINFVVIFGIRSLLVRKGIGRLERNIINR